MDALGQLLKFLREEDANWTRRLRADNFEHDRSRHQAVGRVKQIDDFRVQVENLIKKTRAGDPLEEGDAQTGGELSVQEMPDQPVSDEEALRRFRNQKPRGVR